AQAPRGASWRPGGALPRRTSPRRPHPTGGQSASRRDGALCCAARRQGPRAGGRRTSPQRDRRRSTGIVSLALDRRLAALAEAVLVADGRLDADVVEGARRVTEKAGARLGLGVESTVVALVGPTGAGKSLLFNTLSGAELAAVGRRRPTTSTGQAAVWGDGADSLLDWLEIKRRHRLDAGGLSGLVLLDLPDFDSVETAHRLEVDRIVELADLLVWVVEPQKYEDAALHQGYLRPLSAHEGSMAVVLNQADLLAREEIDALRRDTARLLTEDGLDESPVLVVSARTGAGVDELRGLLARRVASREAAVERLSADAAAAAASLARWCGSSARTRV